MDFSFHTFANEIPSLFLDWPSELQFGWHLGRLVSKKRHYRTFHEWSVCCAYIALFGAAWCRLVFFIILQGQATGIRAFVDWPSSSNVHMGMTYPISLFFHGNSNSIEISFHSHLDSDTVIATKFSTCHDSCAVLACAKNYCNLMASNGSTARRIFHRISIAGKNR